MLADLLGRADFVPPFELFADVLGRRKGRQKTAARLGRDANDPIDEFLAAAFEFERESAPSLQAFLHWLAAGDIEIKRDLDLVYTYFPRLKERRGSLAGYTSGGEQQMCAIGRALMSDPNLVLLDEPSMGLAPQLVEQIFEIVKSINEKEGVSILLAEQNTNIALKYANYGYILENGRVVMDGQAQSLRENEDVKEFYLGISSSGRRSYRDTKNYRRRKRWLT